MALYDELEGMHSTIKHFGVEAADPNELRMLLRKAQTLCDVVLQYDSFRVSRSEEGSSWECQIRSYLDDDTKKSLLYLLSD